MPYDPDFPPHNAELISAQWRDQFHGLKDISDAIAATNITNVVVDSVTTLDPDQPATVNVSVSGNTLHLAFGIPQGLLGAPGTPGAPGPAFAAAVVDGVTTLNPGEQATVNSTFDGTNVRFTFAIPRGADGPASGPITSFVVDQILALNPGEPPAASATFDGSSVRLSFAIPRGNDGLPGEVSATQLASAIAGTSANTNGVPTLDTPFTNDPLSLADGELLRAAYNTLVLALRR